MRVVSRLLGVAGAGLLACACLMPGRAQAEAASPDQRASPGKGAPPQVAKWLPSRGRECRRQGKYRRFCEGPRRAPAPHGQAARLAKRLGLGDRRTAGHLLLKRPRDTWVEAAARKAGVAPKRRALRHRHLLWPVEDGKLWRGFGRVRRGPKRRKPHRGIDVGAQEGTPILAVQAGIVAYADNGVSGYGNLLMVVHPDGSVASYAHCQAIYVFPGQAVARGQWVADVGHTGIARGSHLHFEYRRRGRPRDPMRLFENPPPDARARRHIRRAKTRKAKVHKKRNAKKERDADARKARTERGRRLRER